MIFFFGRGGGVGLFVALAFLLVLAGNGGSGFPLVLLLVLVVPFLLVRAATRRAGQLPAGGRWQGGQLPYPGPAGQPGSWDSPPEPVLPPVEPADVSSLRDRLGHDVRSLDPGEDPVARQAMADASERYQTASDLLERATSDAQLRTAWLAAVEGLAASRKVRERLGLDLGPPVPALPGTGPQLTRHSRVAVGGREHVGAPAYEPGLPHYFPGGWYGGRHVPGGWYDMPFWPSALLLGGLAGWSAGALTAGAMYGEDLGYGMDGGFDGGFDGGDTGGGGDWGGGGWGSDADSYREGGDWGGGGDWGSGGWGGSGGGGDWGGGGGDWGGGGGGGDFGGGGD